MNAIELQRIANERRADAVTMITRARTGHTGGAMSCLDVLTCLFYDVKRPQDHFLLSKGHSVEGYWAILADLGYFPKEDLRTFSQAGSPLIGHPNNKVPGVEVCTGALGHGLPVGVGMALAAKRTGTDANVYVVMGDGEQAEGSIWEAAMAGANYHLDNLFAVVDRNGPLAGTWSRRMATTCRRCSTTTTATIPRASHTFCLRTRSRVRACPLRRTAPSGTTMCPMKNSSSRPMKRWV